MQILENSSDRTDRRKQRTRAALIDAGQRLFSVHAIDSVSIDDIVAAADVAKGSFYNHFEDKEQLARAIIDMVQSDCEHHIFTANQGVDDAAVRMMQAMCVTMTYAGAHPDRLMALISLSERRTIATTPLNAGVTYDIGLGVTSGRFTQVTVETGVLLALGIIRTTVAHMITEAQTASPLSLATTMGAALLRALGTPAPEAAQIAQVTAQSFFSSDESA